MCAGVIFEIIVTSSGADVRTGATLELASLWTPGGAHQTASRSQRGSMPDGGLLGGGCCVCSLTKQ